MAKCNRCQSDKVSWKQSKAGKWYLVNTNGVFHSNTCNQEPREIKEDPKVKIDILSWVGSKDGISHAGVTSGFKTIEDARGHISRWETKDDLWKQATRIRITDETGERLEKVNPDDPELAPYSIVKISYPSFRLPQVPYDYKIALMRRAAAQGTVALAKLAHTANYNGHYNTLTWNDYRGYYVGEYTWAGRNVWFRGTNFKQALEIAKQVYKNQGLGASLVVVPQNANDLEILESDPDFMTGEDDRSWWSWKHQEANNCVDYMGGVNYQRFNLLEESETEEEFRQKLEEHREALRGYQTHREQQLSQSFEEALKHV